MGIKVLPTIACYWSSNPQLGCAWISSVMSRNRYQRINQFLHVCDDRFAVKKGDDGYDPLQKMRPVIEHLKTKFSNSYSPSKNLSVDEAMIGYTGRLAFKQYMPMKPTKWGIKTWEICDSQNGYCLNFDVYTGSKNTKSSERGLGFDVVTNLVEPYYGKAHHIYFDRFFTSVDLMTELMRNKTYACGTVNINRKGLPQELKGKKVKSGHTAFYQKDKLMLIVWKDKKQINLLSTNASSSVDSFTLKPESVQLYNAFMGGVDRNDQLGVYYKVGRSSNKWWRYIFWFLMNVSITNSWIIWSESTHNPPLPATYDHLKFITELAEQLRAGYSSKKFTIGRLARTVKSRVENSNGHELIKILGRPKICRQCSKKGRRTKSKEKNAPRSNVGFVEYHCVAFLASAKFII